MTATPARPAEGRSTTSDRRSAITERAVLFVADRKPVAEALGRDLAGRVDDPERFAHALSAGLAGLADPEYREGSRRIAPGLGPIHGVRWPLLAAVERGFREATRRDGTHGLLELANRLFAEVKQEARWFAFGLLDRVVRDDPERAWQLLRRAGREAGDWITVDSLAHPVGRGILLEPYRWSELETLVFSPSRWERRLVGSTIATMAFVDRRLGRTPEAAGHALDLVGQLIGDDSPDVQKSLSWALRALTLADGPAVLAFVRSETAIARARDDGARAWVLRDTLMKLPPADAAGLRTELHGLRRRPGAPATSRAAETARRFGADLPLPDPDLQRDRFPDLAGRPGDPRP
jgi:3-methyladenine DNA glycosylase AlkD